MISEDRDNFSISSTTPEATLYQTDSVRVGGLVLLVKPSAFYDLAARREQHKLIKHHGGRGPFSVLSIVSSPEWGGGCIEFINGKGKLSRELGCCFVRA